MERMGAVFTEEGAAVCVDGGRSRLHEPDSAIDVGNSGTGMRLMAGWCAPMPWLTVLQGDSSLHRRPMGRVIEPLTKMGARIDGRSNATLAPLTIRGGQLKGIEFHSPIASAQLKSAVLIAGLSAEGRTLVHEPMPTRMHTEEMLTQAGVDVDIEEHNDGSVTIAIRPSALTPLNLDVPGDPSQAAFWMVAAAVVPDSDITIDNVYVGPGRNGLIEVMQRMGADIELTHRDAVTADIRVRHSRLKGIDVSGEEVPSLIDELPIFAIAAATAEGVTNVRDAMEMRVKESDRIAAVVGEMGGLGVAIVEHPDGFSISGDPDARLTGGVVNAHLDHRIAMTGAIAGLLSATPTIIHGWESVATSYPGFADDLNHLTGGQSR